MTRVQVQVHVQIRYRLEVVLVDKLVKNFNQNSISFQSRYRFLEPFVLES